MPSNERSRQKMSFQTQSATWKPVAVPLGISVAFSKGFVSYNVIYICTHIHIKKEKDKGTFLFPKKALYGKFLSFVDSYFQSINSLQNGIS